MRRMLLPLALALGVAGCVGTRPQHRTSPGLSLIIGRMEFERIVLPFPHRDAVYLHLARLDDKGGVDEDHPLSSDHAQGGWVYFFNVPPGRYALVSGTYLAHGLRYTYRLKGDNIRHTAIDVKPGKVAFLGEVSVKRRFQGWDVFAYNVLKSAAVILPPWRPLSTEVDAAFKVVDRGSQLEARALASAREHLAGTQWLEVIEPRLAALGGPPIQPITEGTLRKRVVPAEKAKYFHWHDTLEWPSRPVSGGLEWSEPKGRARVAVTFRKSGEPGFEPMDKFMRELKALGSPEDEHAFANVAISTWTGSSLRYTKYVYPQPYLTGSKQEVFLTEVTLVPAEMGYFVLYYRARRKDFDKFREAYLEFRRRLELAPPPKPKEDTSIFSF